MPQGRRKTPFSNKQKKAQLQQKRERKRFEETSVVSSFGARKENQGNVDVLNQQPSTSTSINPNRYRLMFKKETNEEVQERKLLANRAFDTVPREKLEVDHVDVFHPGSELDIPKRPSWSYKLSKDQLETQEQKYFREYLADLERKFGDKELSHFEMNLETWRQLWRVLEFSDIILLIVDIRFPVYHYSPALYDYVTKDLKKDIILVLNKIDLVPAPLVLAWKKHLKNNFPNLNILCFASYAGMILKEGKKGKRVGNLHMAIEGSRRLLKTCEDIVQGQVDLSSWKKKIDSEAAQIGATGEAFDESDSEEEDDDDDRRRKHSSKKDYNQIKSDTSPYQGKRYQDNMLTIGFIGHPNVGKSSFLNAVLGKKVVSVSKTPGHTKHYQTIMLTPNVRLCDCPGLVFPSLVPRAVQVLMGCYPIAQLREPYSAIEFLSQRVPVPSILNIKYPEPDLFPKGSEVKWSSYEICEEWAIKRGFRTAKAARPDAYRAANNILRMALDGRTLCLAFLPPNYTKDEAMWSRHPELPEIIAVQVHRKKASKERVDYFEGISKQLRSQLSDEDEDISEISNRSSSEDGDSEGSSNNPPDNKFASLGHDVTC